MTLDIVTPEKIVLTDEVDEISVDTLIGQITILQNHENLIARLMPGEMVVRKQKKEYYLAVTGGFLEIQNNNITILADYAVRSEDIEVKKALEAQEKAKMMLKKQKDQISTRDFALAEAELRRSITQLNVANKRRKTKI